MFFIAQKVKIPTATNPGTSPSPSPSHSPSPTGEGAESGNDDSFDEEDLKELRKVPKLHMRPRTAPAVESRKGVRYVTWNEAQRNKGKSRPMSGHGQKKFSSQVGTVQDLLKFVCVFLLTTFVYIQSKPTTICMGCRRPRIERTL